MEGSRGSCARYCDCIAKIDQISGAIRLESNLDALAAQLGDHVGDVRGDPRLDALGLRCNGIDAFGVVVIDGQEGALVR